MSTKEIVMYERHNGYTWNRMSYAHTLHLQEPTTKTTSQQHRTSVSTCITYIYVYIYAIYSIHILYSHTGTKKKRLNKNTTLRLYFCTLVTPTTSSQDSRHDKNSSPTQHIAADYTITPYLTTTPDKTYTIQDTLHTLTPATTTTNTSSIPAFTLQLHNGIWLGWTWLIKKVPCFFFGNPGAPIAPRRSYREIELNAARRIFAPLA